ncbi:MAG TPA: adenine phosphoribosyltransferase [Candidatus Magasanikbacteria bacterium]|nr:adenine phosphoribosyltransferase [Candidatus Magasanikbacteria bacterium]
MTDHIKKAIRTISDWPEPGQEFYDYMPILANPKLFNALVEEFCKPYLDENVDLVISVDARGLILAAPIAYALDAGLALLSPKDKMAWTVDRGSNQQNQINNMLAMDHAAIQPGQRVVIIDDILASGKTSGDTAEILENMGVTIIGVSFLFSLGRPSAHERLADYQVHVVLKM